MSLRTRRILYIIFIIAFLVITPLVFLYASGYDWQSGFKIQKTGMLVIDTKPRGAKIFLDDKPQKLFFSQFLSGTDNFITTPAKIKNIAPAQYDIKVELSNYWPWQKKLTISPGETTYAEDIVLFKKSVPILLANFKNGNIFISPRHKSITIFSEANFFRFHIDNEEIENLVFATSTPVWAKMDGDVFWSPNNEKLLIGHLLIDLNAFDRSMDIFSKIDNQAKEIKWDDANNDLIYYRLKDDIHRYDLNSNTDTIIVTGCDCLTYLPKNGKINLAVSKDELINPKTATGVSLDTFTVPASDYSFVNPNSDWLNLYDQKNNTLYLIDPSAEIKPLRDTINNVSATYWIDSRRMLYANDYEVWLYDADNANKKILTRVSRLIKDIIWHPSNNYIIFTTDNTINILELDNREKYNITKILEFDSIKETFLKDDGHILYFYGRIGNQEGLYKLDI